MAGWSLSVADRMNSILVYSQGPLCVLKPRSMLGHRVSLETFSALLKGSIAVSLGNNDRGNRIIVPVVLGSLYLLSLLLSALPCVSMEPDPLEYVCDHGILHI